MERTFEQLLRCYQNKSMLRGSYKVNEVIFTFEE